MALRWATRRGAAPGMQADRHLTRRRRILAGEAGGAITPPLPVFDVRVDRGGRRAVVRLSGILDGDAVQPVVQVVHQLVDGGCREVRLQADGLVAAGPSGHRALVAVERAAREEGASVTWC